MDQSTREQQSRTALSAADALIAAINAQQDSPVVKITPLRAILPLVAQWVRMSERRIAQLEQCIASRPHVPQAQQSPVERELLKLIATAAHEGMLAPIPDEQRPGGIAPQEQDSHG